MSRGKSMRGFLFLEFYSLESLGVHTMVNLRCSQEIVEEAGHCVLINQVLPNIAKLAYTDEG